MTTTATSPDSNNTIVRYGLHFKSDHNFVSHKSKSRSATPLQPLVRDYTEINGTSTPLTTRSLSVESQSPRRKLALLIGINYIGSANALNGCIADVINMKNVLVYNYGYDATNITTLTDDATDPLLLPTRKNIIKCIKRIVADLQPFDELFIHYSGHGTQVPDVGETEDLNPDTPNRASAICPCDFDNYDGIDGLITDYKLNEILVSKLIPSVKLRMVVDACHSGSMLNLPYLFRGGKQFVKIGLTDNTRLDCIMLSGCKDNQTSADAFINKKFSGALTWALLTALGTNPTLTYEQLLTAIHQLLSEDYEQIPMLSVYYPDLVSLKVDF